MKKRKKIPWNYFIFAVFWGIFLAISIFGAKTLINTLDEAAKTMQQINFLTTLAVISAALFTYFMSKIYEYEEKGKKDG